MKGVLGSFGRAFILRSNDNSCLLLREDLRQFLNLMETVAGYYKTEGTNQQTQVTKILQLCREEEDDRQDIQHVREILEGICGFPEENTRL